MNSTTTDYFERARHDVAALVPSNSQRILEIGAGFGALGRILSQRGDVLLDAVELNPAAAPHLDGLYRRFWIGDIQTLSLDDALSDYDCIVFPDVLEHLEDPWTQLAKLCERLRPGGYVVASVPNVRNLALLYRLIVQGRWEYENSGLLDRTHLRFFTRHSIVEMLKGADLTVERWGMNRDGYTGVRKVVASVAKLFIPEIDVCQYLVLARKS